LEGRQVSLELREPRPGDLPLAYVPEAVTGRGLPADAPLAQGLGEEVRCKLGPLARPAEGQQETALGPHGEERHRIRAVVVVRPRAARRIVVCLLVYGEDVRHEGSIGRSRPGHVERVVEGDEACDGPGVD